MMLQNTIKDYWSDIEQEKAEVLDKHIFGSNKLSLSSLASDLGLRVKSHIFLNQNISGAIKPPQSDGSWTIFVNKFENKKRQRFTVAHEIAHFLLHTHLIDGDGLEDDVLFRSSLSNKYEAEANRLAADILMPKSKLRESLKTWKSKALDDADIIEAMSNEFDVSKTAMRIRLNMR